MICYLSHPLGCENGNDTVTRQDNIANAGLWLRALTEAGYIVTCPWFAFVATLPSELRPKAFANQVLIMKTCDTVFFCGNWSPHMQIERTVAERAGLQIVDLTDLGYAPPAMDKEWLRRVIEQRLST